MLSRSQIILETTSCAFLHIGSRSNEMQTRHDRDSVGRRQPKVHCYWMYNSTILYRMYCYIVLWKPIVHACRRLYKSSLLYYCCNRLLFLIFLRHTLHGRTLCWLYCCVAIFNTHLLEHQLLFVVRSHGACTGAIGIGASVTWSSSKIRTRRNRNRISKTTWKSKEKNGRCDVQNTIFLLNYSSSSLLSGNP